MKQQKKIMTQDKDKKVPDKKPKKPLTALEQRKLEEERLKEEGIYSFVLVETDAKKRLLTK